MKINSDNLLIELSDCDYEGTEKGSFSESENSEDSNYSHSNNVMEMLINDQFDNLNSSPERIHRCKKKSKYENESNESDKEITDILQSEYMLAEHRLQQNAIENYYGHQCENPWAFYPVVNGYYNNYGIHGTEKFGYPWGPIIMPYKAPTIQNNMEINGEELKTSKK